MPEGGEDKPESAEYDLPEPGKYLNLEFIESAPLDEGVEKLVEYFDKHIYETVAKFDNAVGRDEYDTKHTSGMIWEYMKIKRSDYKWRTSPASDDDLVPESLQGLPTDLQESAKEMSRELRKEFNVSYRQGLLDGSKRMMNKAGLDSEAYVIDKLFERAESEASVVVVPHAGRLTSGKR